MALPYALRVRTVFDVLCGSIALRLDSFQLPDIARIAEAATKLLLADDEAVSMALAGRRDLMPAALSKFLHLVVCGDIGLFMRLRGVDANGEDISTGLAWTASQLRTLDAAMRCIQFEPPLGWPHMSNDALARLRHRGRTLLREPAGMHPPI